MTILRKSEIKSNLKFLTCDDIVLECELSSANASAKWYKDGCRVQGDERFCEEEEGAFRSLVILNAELQDSGEYFLDAGDDSISFQVTVEGKVDLVEFKGYFCQTDINKSLFSPPPRASSDHRRELKRPRLPGDDGRR